MWFFVNVNDGNCELVMSPCGVCHVRMASDAVRGELCNRPRGFQKCGPCALTTWLAWFEYVIKDPCCPLLWPDDLVVRLELAAIRVDL